MCGDMITASFYQFHYSAVLKDNISFEEKNINMENSQNFFQSTISKEIAISGVKVVEKKKEMQEPQEIIPENPIEESFVEENNEHQEIIEEVPETLPTSVVQTNNLPESYNTLYKDIKIKNETNFNLTQAILTPDIEFSDKKNILIFHTHTCESYTQTQENSYVASGNYRTTDLNYSVARVGTVLEESLTAKGFHVMHDMNYHDYPAYNGSYSRSFNTVKSLLEKNPTTQFVIDLHRDAIGSMNNYAPAVQIGDETVAQVMFVIGTNGGGLEHPNWQTNLKFAIKIQEKANEMYPGLFRPIILRNSRYNQNLADSACIIEVGATGNTLEQTTGSMKYLAEVIYQVMQ